MTFFYLFYFDTVLTGTNFYRPLLYSLVTFLHASILFMAAFKLKKKKKQRKKTCDCLFGLMVSRCVRALTIIATIAILLLSKSPKNKPLLRLRSLNQLPPEMKTRIMIFIEDNDDRAIHRTLLEEKAK